MSTWYDKLALVSMVSTLNPAFSMSHLGQDDVMPKKCWYRVSVPLALTLAAVLLYPVDRPVWFDKQAKVLICFSNDSRYLWTAALPGDKVVLKQIDLQLQRCVNEFSIPVPHPNICHFTLSKSGDRLGFVIVNTSTSSTACKVDLASARVVSRDEHIGPHPYFSPNLSFLVSLEFLTLLNSQSQVILSVFDSFVMVFMSLGIRHVSTANP